MTRGAKVAVRRLRGEVRSTKAQARSTSARPLLAAAKERRAMADQVYSSESSESESSDVS